MAAAAVLYVGVCVCALHCVVVETSSVRFASHWHKWKLTAILHTFCFASQRFYPFDNIWLMPHTTRSFAICHVPTQHNNLNTNIKYISHLYESERKRVVIFQFFSSIQHFILKDIDRSLKRISHTLFLSSPFLSLPLSSLKPNNLLPSGVGLLFNFCYLCKCWVLKWELRDLLATVDARLFLQSKVCFIVSILNGKSPLYWSDKQKAASIKLILHWNHLFDFIYWLFPCSCSRNTACALALENSINLFIARKIKNVWKDNAISRD